MNYGFELMSEIIPLCIVAVLGIGMKKGGEKDFLPSIIILSIIYFNSRSTINEQTGTDRTSPEEINVNKSV